MPGEMRSYVRVASGNVSRGRASKQWISAQSTDSIGVQVAEVVTTMPSDQPPSHHNTAAARDVVLPMACAALTATRLEVRSASRIRSWHAQGSSPRHARANARGSSAVATAARASVDGRGFVVVACIESRACGRDHGAPRLEADARSERLARLAGQPTTFRGGDARHLAEPVKGVLVLFVERESEQERVQAFALGALHLVGEAAQHAHRVATSKLDARDRDDVRRRSCWRIYATVQAPPTPRRIDAVQRTGRRAAARPRASQRAGWALRRRQRPRKHSGPVAGFQVSTEGARSGLTAPLFHLERPLLLLELARADETAIE